MRILLVEDEKKVVEFVARGLRAENFAVDSAPDGEGGWDMICSFQYDLIILDLMLPKISGSELLRRIRLRNETVPILVLTAKDSTNDKVTHFEAGADDYLTKPFGFAELVVRIKALLRRGSVQRSNIIRIADLEIDRVTHQVKRAGQRITFTTKEFALLEYLASHPGRVFSRTMIIDHVWDESFEGLTNIVDVYVRHLRRKIDDPFTTKLIQTIRGAGYSLGNDADS